ncbi:MAG: S-methyl-5-thioribose-1-phosphate isomerase [Chloroflexi bacterium]|nr:S-methyl-5-thioribose-1-phosphate isomerase [Chloroflexota bacterium]
MVQSRSVATLAWLGDRLRLLDQTRLPHEVVSVDCADCHGVAAAIRSLQVRGAPAIGVAAAYGVALAALASNATEPALLLAEIDVAVATLGRTRPTAVNLFWALDRMRRAAAAAAPEGLAAVRQALVAEAQRIEDEDADACRRMGEHGAALLPPQARVLTHCNAGALATAGIGTALGVLRTAFAQGRLAHVYVDETRPVLQGARLTAWELARDGIPVTLITDNMAAHFMSRRAIDCVVVGADRIAANGDVANKIGTYGVAVLARFHGLPLIVVAPTSTIDLATPSGLAIPIEQRNPAEVTHLAGVPVAPAGVVAANPAFDVTPNALVAAIVTEQGVIQPPFAAGLRAAVAGGREQTGS